jgi:hypothetical protein
MSAVEVGGFLGGFEVTGVVSMVEVATVGAKGHGVGRGNTKSVVGVGVCCHHGSSDRFGSGSSGRRGGETGLRRRGVRGGRCLELDGGFGRREECPVLGQCEVVGAGGGTAVSNHDALLELDRELGFKELDLSKTIRWEV